MLHELDSALRALVERELGEDADVEIDFDAPTKDWASHRNRPTIDIYLYDIRQDVSRYQFGTIDNNVAVAAGASSNLGISSNWDGAVNVGTGCNSDGSSCTTGGPTWDGVTPFSRAEFNYYAIPGSVTYDISLIYGVRAQT